MPLNPSFENRRISVGEYRQHLHSNKFLLILTILHVLRLKAEMFSLLHVLSSLLKTCFPSLGFYRDHQWPLNSEDNDKVPDIRGGIEGVLKNGAQIVSDPDLGAVVSLNASEAWILMGDFKGILSIG